MFGLLKPVGFDLPLAAGGTWSSVVCSTCVRLGDEFGTLARFAAGPDTALLAALYEAQIGQASAATVHYCPLRVAPARLWRGGHRGCRFAAAISLLAASARLEDHLRDGDPLPVPRFIARRLARRWASEARESAAAVGFDTRPLQEQIADQREREGQPGQPPTYYAEPTALCFGEVFAHTARLSGRPENVEPLRQAGHAFGQQVYLLDAAADYVEDLRRGRFNPFAHVGGSRAAVRQQAQMLVNEAQEALERHLERATMPRPGWVRPVLVDALRHVGRCRLGCSTACVSARPPHPLTDKEKGPSLALPRLRRSTGRCAAIRRCAAAGAVAGFACGFYSGVVHGEGGVRAERGGESCCGEASDSCCGEMCCKLCFAHCYDKCCSDCCGKCCCCQGKCCCCQTGG
jgi:hypothetical protein